jgi:hypothetical protein
MMWQLVRWIACMLREFNLVGCSYLDIIDYRLGGRRSRGGQEAANKLQSNSRRTNSDRIHSKSTGR